MDTLNIIGWVIRILAAGAIILTLKWIWSDPFYRSTRAIAAVIMLQTLYFKFSGAQESIAIFTKMGMEPWGRYGTGVAELVASILLLINPLAKWGALLASGTMAGAIASHLFILGIESNGDGGYLFMLACTVMICSLFVLWVNKDELIKQVKSFIS